MPTSRNVGPATVAPVVDTRQLTKDHPGRPGAVDRLDLRVEDREIFGLLGPNGAGKTTTVGMLATRVRPTSGTAVVAGYDVVREPAAVKAAIGVVTQTNTLDRSLQVIENLVFHGRYLGLSWRDAARRADAVVEQLGLGDHTAAAVDSLSGGFTQRVMLARALVARPRLLFLDEPTNGLDPESRQALWAIVEALPDQGVSIVVTTHRLDEAEQLCTRVGIMDHGVLLAVDSPAALVQQGGDRRTVRVRTAGDPGALVDVVEAEVVDRDDGSVTFATTDGPGLAEAVLVAARARDVPIVGVDVGSSTLESTFLRLVGEHRAARKARSAGETDVAGVVAS